LPRLRARGSALAALAATPQVEAKAIVDAAAAYLPVSGEQHE